MKVRLGFQLQIVARGSHKSTRRLIYCLWGVFKEEGQFCKFYVWMFIARKLYTRKETFSFKIGEESCGRLPIDYLIEEPRISFYVKEVELAKKYIEEHYAIEWQMSLNWWHSRRIGASLELGFGMYFMQKFLLLLPLLSLVYCFNRHLFCSTCIISSLDGVLWHALTSLRDIKDYERPQESLTTLVWHFRK